MPWFAITGSTPPLERWCLPMGKTSQRCFVQHIEPARFFSGAQSATARDARVVGRWLLAMHYSLALLSLSTRARAPSAFVYVLKLKLRLLRFHKISNIFSFDTSRLFLAVRKLIIFHENLCVPGAGQAGPLSHRNGSLPYGNFLFYVRFSGTCRKD